LKRPSEELSLRDRLIGLGERSHRKSYYPELQARAALLERFRVLLDESQDAVLLLEVPGWIVVDLNAAARRCFTGGAPPPPDASVLDVVPAAVRAQLAEGLAAAAAGRAPPFVVATPCDCAAPRDFELAARPATFEGREFLVLVARDVTERAAAERALRASERRFRALFEGAPDAMFLVGAGGEILDANPEASRALGYSRDELTRLRVFDIDAGAAPEFAARRRRIVAGPITFAGEHRRKDGTTFPVEVRLSAMRDGGSLAVVRDVSERVRMEEALRAKERQLLMSQKMEAIGQLAGGVAHDFNNLLTAMMGYIDLIREHSQPGAAVREDADELLAAARRAADLTRQLLAFGRKQIMQPRLVSVSAIVAGLERMLRRLIAENIALETELAGDVWPEMADPGQLEQVVVNLVDNARDAMPHGGALRIRTRNLAGDPARVELTVADSGVGMDAATRARVFEPFFTTKEPGKGTGLGLATVHGIVLQSGGDVTIESEPGRGAIFRVTLPRAIAGAASAPTPAAARSPRPSGRGTILVVEDDAAVRRLVSRLLARDGYTVLEAGSCAEATRASAAAREIDLLLCDAVLPDLDGAEVADRLCAERPGLRVLFMSGYSAGERFHRRLKDPSVRFIGKPFAHDDLLEAVRDALEPG
jgi:PAS domain S-box-containing protein